MAIFSIGDGLPILIFGVFGGYFLTKKVFIK